MIKVFCRWSASASRSSASRRALHSKQFSEMVGISTNYLSDLERGVSSPRMDKLVTIINALGCSADEVFADVLENGYQVRASRLTDELAKLPPQKEERAFATFKKIINGKSEYEKSHFPDPAAFPYA